jgi:hypothetical protein
VVKASAMLDMFNELGTQTSLKRMVDLPIAEFLSSPIKSHDVAGAQREVENL